MSPEGWILGIETSQSTGSVALGHSHDDQEIDIEPFPVGLVHGKEIIPRIDALFERHPQAREHLCLVAVSAGPGSFTGIRIGVSAAKTIAWACDVPACPVSSLEIIAENTVEDGDWRALIDIRKGSCATATFRRKGNHLDRISEDVVISWEELLVELSDGERLIGSGSRSIPGTENSPGCAETLDIPRATSVVEIARREFRLINEGTGIPSGVFSSPHDLNPVYLEMSSAEKNRARTQEAGDR